MSIEQMPLDNLSEFTPVERHPMAEPDGYSVFPAIDGVAHQLQGYREAAGLTQRAMATRFDWSISKVTRTENGEIPPSVVDAEVFLLAYGVGDKALIETVRRNRHTPQSGPYTSILTPSQQRAMGYEAVAERIGIYAPYFVPDILLTSGYAQHLDGVFHPDYTPEQGRLSMELRKARAAYLLGEFARPMEIIIAEEALRRPEGGPHPLGPGAQYAQLHKVISGIMTLSTAEGRQAANSALNPNITIQIVPLLGGLYRPRLVPYAHDILHMQGRPDPAVYTEGLLEEPGTFHSGLDGSTRERSARFDRLRANLPGPEHTPEILDTILASLRS
jgi:transcriptional regulator with XRE-family HTH domain